MPIKHTVTIEFDDETGSLHVNRPEGGQGAVLTVFMLEAAKQAVLQPPQPQGSPLLHAPAGLLSRLPRPNGGPR